MDLSKFAFFFLTIQLLFTIKLPAQDNFLQNKKVGLSTHYGFVLKNKRETAHLADQRPLGLELEICKKPSGNKLWHQYYRNPVFGVSLQYWFLDPSKKLGNQLGLVFHFKNKIAGQKNSILYYRIGAGLGYVEKRFDLYTNNQNNLLSSRINFVLNGRVGYEYKFANNISGFTGIDLLHFSNGGMKLPNQGINIPNIFLGFRYHFEENIAKNTLKDQDNDYKYWLAIFNLAAGSKMEYPVDNPNKPVFAFSAYAGRRLTYKSTLVAGLDLIYDGTMLYWGDSTQIENRWNYTKMGIAAGHELSIGKLTLITHIGYLAYRPIVVLSGLYQRYGVRYYLFENLAASVAMKAHYGAADYVEWGITYRLH